MDDYRHHVALKYETADQLNRHAKRLIDKEGFMSGGVQPDATYLFVKNVTKDEYDALIRFGRTSIAYGTDAQIRVAFEQRTAW